jgi:hypothetical protein
MIDSKIPTLKLFFQQKKKNNKINRPEKLGSGIVYNENLYKLEGIYSYISVLKVKNWYIIDIKKHRYKNVRYLRLNS